MLFDHTAVSFVDLARKNHFRKEQENGIYASRQNRIKG
jgi:hypothetical protein